MKHNILPQNDTTQTNSKQKISWKIKAPVLLVLVLAFIVGINAFFNKFYLVSPVEFQNPIRTRGSIYPIKITEPELNKIIDEETQKVKKDLLNLKPAKEVMAQENKSIAWFIDMVWFKETTRGKNRIPGGLQDLCAKKGLWNEYGYGGMSNPICFKNQIEADETLTKWFEKHLAKMTEAQTFCFYRHGEVMDTCECYREIQAL